MFAVVFECEYKTKVLFQGTKVACNKFMRENPEWTSDFCFIQELV